LQDPDVPKIGHDLKRHFHDLWALGIDLAGVAGDVKLLDYVLVAHRRTHDLESISQRHLGHTLAYVGSEPEDLEEAARVLAETAHVVQSAHRRLIGRLDQGSELVYREIELPLTPVLARMERWGVRLDTDALGAIRTDIAQRAFDGERLCHELAGREFKVNSPKEVGDLLFGELGLPPSKKTATGTWSTDSQVLESLAELHPLPAAILEHRMLQKLEGTYLAKLPQYVAPDGRIHTTLNQSGAATGRLSSADPNLQNIPIRTFEGRRIRQAFVAEPGFSLLSFDYSQVELRILAHYCGSPALQRSFQQGEDIHRRTASEVWGVPMAQVTPEQRSAAKAINFGLLYGMSAFRLSRDLQIERAEAERYMKDYFGRMPEVAEWIAETHRQCAEEGFVTTLFGRRRLIPEIFSKNFNERSQGEREAVNTRVQGTAADVIKRAMVRADLALQGTGARMILQVHDELLIEAPEGEGEAIVPRVVEAMTGAAQLSVPLAVNWGAGRTWSEAHG
jgi:DNA polymerase-1